MNRCALCEQDKDEAILLVHCTGQGRQVCGRCAWAVAQSLARCRILDRSSDNRNDPVPAALRQIRIVLNRRETIVEQGTTTLRFCRRTMIAGIGTAVRITSEIVRTLRQFPSIKRVVILDYRGNCFSDLSARNLCLHHDNI